MKQSQQHKGRINKNEDSEIEEFFHEESEDQSIKRNERIYYTSVESRIENNRQIEKEKEEIKIREKNKSVLKEKLSHKKVVTKYTQDVNKKSDILSNKH
jgi:hypothetical protein